METHIKIFLYFPMALRDKLKKISKINRIKILERFDSKIDNTKKYLFLLEDDNIIESVLWNTSMA